MAGTVKQTPRSHNSTLKRRSAPLRPRRGLARTRKPMQAMRPEKRAVRQAFRQTVLDRDRVCQWEGCREVATDPHHVVAAGKGGKDVPSNGVGLCRPHHDWITKTAEGIREGRRRGFIR